MIFALGVAIGALLMVPVFQAKWAGREQQRQWEARKLLPGMFVEAAQFGISIREEGQKFILEEGVEPSPEGVAHRRVFISGGRRKFAPTGRALPDSFVKVTEDYAVPVPDAHSKVEQFSFAYADRVRVRLMKGAEEDMLAERLRARGGGLQAVGENGWREVRLATHDLRAVPEMLAWLQTQRELVVAAEEIGIDWRAEVEATGK